MSTNRPSRGLERRHNNPYTQVGNRPINDADLSAEALAVLVYLLSKPPGWVVIPAEIAKRFKFGRNRVYAVLKELIGRGYVLRFRQHAEDGKWTGYSYQVWDDPAAAADERASKSRVPDGEDTVEAPCTGQPYTVNGDALVKKDSNQIPHTPPEGADDRIDRKSDKKPHPAAVERWTRFEDAFPWEPHHSRERAQRQFLKLSAEEQEKALRWVGRYAADCKSTKRYVKEASRWIAGKCWQGYEAQALKVAKVAGSDKPLVFVRVGTPAWEAWGRYKRARGEPWGFSYFNPDHKANGKDMPSLFPPGAEQHNHLQRAS